MATVQDILNDARALLDEYNEDGAVIAPSEVATLETNGVRFVNMAVQEIYSKSRKFSTHKITRKPVLNGLGNGNWFDIKSYLGDGAHIVTEAVDSAKSYYFEVDGECYVEVQYLEDGAWEIANTVYITDAQVANGMTSFTGFVDQAYNTHPIRLRFAGYENGVVANGYFYNIQNVALYKERFKLSDIPVYKQYVPYELPADFGELQKIVVENGKDYNVNGSYKWEGDKTLYVAYDFEGEMRITYNPIPVEITSKEDNIPIINPLARQFIIYYTAAKIAITENPSFANFFEQKSNELKVEATKGQPAGEQRIVDIYFNNRGY